MKLSHLKLLIKKIINESVKIQKKLNENISPKTQEKIGNLLRELGSRGAAYKLVNIIVTNKLGIGLEDLPDTATLAHGCDEIEEALKIGDFENALKLAATTAKNLVDEEGGEGLMEGDEADAACDMDADDEADHYHKHYGSTPNQKSKQKSTKFFGKTPKPKQTDVRDMDWSRIKQGIDRGTLKETDGNVSNPIDGQSNNVAAGKVNKILSDLSKGMFSDNSWEAINRIFEKLRSTGLDVTILNAKYGGHADTSNGMPKYKEWQISIPFTNKVGKPMELVGQITAHGAGSIEQPLDRYDITAYVSAIPKRK